MTTQIHCTGNGGQIKCVIVVLDGNIALVSKIGNVSQSAGVNNENFGFFFTVLTNRESKRSFSADCANPTTFQFFFVIRH